MIKKKEYSGYSVIEILVVIGIFAILSIVAAQSIILTLRSERKNDSMINVKEQIDYAANVIERNLQTASYVFIYPDSVCDGSTATPSVGFATPYGGRGYFACLDVLSIGANPFYNLNASTNNPRIASASGSQMNFNFTLTNDDLEVTECFFTCTKIGEKSFIDFSITASGEGLPASDDNTISSSRRVFVRSAERM